MRDTIQQQFLTAAEAARYCGFTPRALIKWRHDGTGPRYIRIGGENGRVRYDRNELDAWMRARSYAHTSAESAAR